MTDHPRTFPDNLVDAWLEARNACLNYNDKPNWRTLRSAAEDFCHVYICKHPPVIVRADIQKYQEQTWDEIGLDAILHQELMYQQLMLQAERKDSPVTPHPAP